MSILSPLRFALILLLSLLTLVIAPHSWADDERWYEVVNSVSVDDYIRDGTQSTVLDPLPIETEEAIIEAFSTLVEVFAIEDHLPLGSDGSASPLGICACAANALAVELSQLPNVEFIGIVGLHRYSTATRSGAGHAAVLIWAHGVYLFVDQRGPKSTTQMFKNYDVARFREATEVTIYHENKIDLVPTAEFMAKVKNGHRGNYPTELAVKGSVLVLERYRARMLARINDYYQKGHKIILIIYFRDVAHDVYESIAEQITEQSRKSPETILKAFDSC